MAVGAALATVLAFTGIAAAQPTVEREGFALTVGERAGGQLCLKLTVPDDAYGSESCDAIPVGPYAAVVVQRTSTDAFFGVVVDRDVLEVESAGERIATTALRSGVARVALVRTNRPDTVVRTFDAGGALAGAVQPDSDPDPFQGRVVFRAGAYTLRARRGDQLYPTPLIRDRTRPTTCLAVTDGGGSAGCLADEDLDAYGVELHDRCAPRHAIVSGLVSPEVATVRVVLGSGRRLDLAARPLPASLGPGHLVGAAIPRGAAVRALIYRSASGRALAQDRIGQPPTGRPCDDENNGFGGSFNVYAFDPGYKALAPLTPVEPGSPLRAADGEQLTLCTAIGNAKTSCRIPPVDADGTYLDHQGDAIGGPVPPGIKAVALRLDDGSKRRIAATAGSGYGGQYAGLTRFVSFRLARGEVRRATANADNGRHMGTISVAGRFSVRTRRERLGGGLIAIRRRTVSGERRERSVCVVPRGLGRYALFTASLCDRAPMPRVVVAVTCRPRRSIVLGRGDQPLVRLRDGRVLRPRVRTLRGVGSFWSVRLPAGAAVAAVDGDRIGLPPAARQCGYAYAA